MTTRLPTGRAGQLAALALLALLLLVLWGLLVAPALAAFQAAQAELDDKRALAEKMTALAAALPRLEAAAAARTGSGTGDAGRLLEGGTDALAAAALQTRIGRLADTAGVALSSVETLAGQASLETLSGQTSSEGLTGQPQGTLPDQSSLRRIGITLHVGGHYAALVRFIAAIEAGTPKLLVDDVEFHLPGTPDADPVLDAELTIRGLRRSAP